MVLPGIAAVAFGLLFVAWFLYPAAMWVRARGRVAGTGPAGDPHDRVCAVIATRDDPALVAARVTNLRSCAYPAHLLRVVVSVDATSAFPLEAYQGLLGGSADVVAGDRPGGKALALNAGVRASGDCAILLFADTSQVFNPDAITKLVAALDTGAAGATGRYTQDRDDTGMAAWADFEAAIRAGQAKGRGVVSATGAILAVRRSYWRELPAGLICDDLFTGLSIARQGGRLEFCPDAVARDTRSLTRDQQFARRARTLTGLVQYCAVVPSVLVPWGNPLWLHFMLHKILRLCTPLLLGVGLFASALLVAARAPMVLAVLLAAAVVGLMAARLVAPAVFRAAAGRIGWLVRLQLVPLVAISNGLRGRWSVWAPATQGGEVRS